jgi:hypothetical protein
MRYGATYFGQRIASFIAFDGNSWIADEAAWKLGQLNGVYLLTTLAEPGQPHIYVGETHAQTLVVRTRVSPLHYARYPSTYSVFAYPNLDGLPYEVILARERMLMTFVNFAMPGSLYSKAGAAHRARHHFHGAAMWLQSIIPSLAAVSPELSFDSLFQFAACSESTEATQVREFVNANKV